MTLLELREIDKAFGGVRVLQGAGLTVEPGSVTALIGPNGAGKSTLANIVSGFVRPDRGVVLLNGVDVTRWSPHRRAVAGLGRSFQNLELFSDLSARENVLMGASRRYQGVQRWFRRPGPRDHDEVSRQLTAVGLSSVGSRPVDSLAFGMAKLVEPARVATMKPTLLVLDEPAAGLTAGRTEALGRWIRDLAASGPGVLLIEHNMTLVMGIADYIHVLDHGVRIAEGTPREISADPVVIDAYLGEGFRHD